MFHCRPQKLATFLGLLLPAWHGLADAGEAAPEPALSERIVLQGFNWESYRVPSGWFRVLSENAERIGRSGFTHLWFPPVSRAIEEEDGPEWKRTIIDSRGYLPLDYYNFNSKYGSESELRQAVADLRNAGVASVADLVVNHVGKFDHGWTLPWAPFGPSWGAWAVCRGDKSFQGGGGVDTGEDFGPGADLDLLNPEVQGAIRDWMLFLKEDIGFAGWRFDYAKGYSGEVVGALTRATGVDFAVGEIWTDLDYSCKGLCYNQDANRQRTVHWIRQTWEQDQESGLESLSAFDFTLKGILQEAIRNGEYWRLQDEQGRQPGVVGLWPSRAVTFIDNHDTGSTQSHWPFGDARQVLQGYAYILTHPGTPSIFWDHFFDWGLEDPLTKLIALRRKHEVQADTPVMIVESRQELYAAFIGETLAFNMGKLSWSPGKDWEVAMQGQFFQIWQKSPDSSTHSAN